MPHVDGVDDDGAGYGVAGKSNSGVGVVGESNSAFGVYGHSESGDAVVGFSLHGTGVRGSSSDNDGVRGQCNSGGGNGVFGVSYSGKGVCGQSDSSYGLYGESNSGVGVCGESSTDDGVIGGSDGGYGVRGSSRRRAGVRGYSSSSFGLHGYSDDSFGLYVGSGSRRAAWFVGDVGIAGSLEKTSGSFKIDHPLDPANKYLCHSFVESPDMKNVYDGIVVLDDKGAAEIQLPDWFDALNKDYRYQLTAIGAPAPNLYIAEEIILSDSTNTAYYSDSGNSNNKNNSRRFKIAGGNSGMKVSWQVTGIRKDPWANTYRIEVERDKPNKERGYYLHPDVYGQPEEKGISHLLFPEEEKKKQELLIDKKDGK